MENSPTSQRTAANQIFNVLRTACEKMLREGKNIEEVTESLSGALQKSHSAQALSILNKLIDQQAASTLAPARNDARAGGTPTQPTSAAAARTHAQTQPTRLAAVPVRAPDEPEEFEDGLL